MGLGLSTRRQGYIVAGLAAIGAVAGIVMFMGSSGASPPGDSRPRYIPTDAQLRSFGVETVTLHSFRTEILTDGYVAANGATGKSAPGQPVLSGQAYDMLQAENDLSAAQMQYRNASAAEDRQHKLYLGDGAALKDWQQSQADLATAAAALASAKSRLRLQGKSGNAAAGAFTVGDNSTVWLIANVREADAGLVHPGDALSASFAAYPERPLFGRVSFVSSVIDPATHRLVVGAQVPNTGGWLKPNMLATVTLLGGETADAPAVPQDCIIYDGDRAHVWVVGSGRSLSSRSVKVGRVSKGYAEIIAGLKEGEQVATTGGLFIDQATTGE
jgi:cobalt-zinc-cadmium efflux system membrane fusion protein